LRKNPVYPPQGANEFRLPLDVRLYWRSFWSLFVTLSPSKLGAAVLLAALALPLASCGRRGALEPPPGTPASAAPVSGTPDAYDTPASAGDLPGQNTANASAAATPAKAGAPQAPPHTPKPFPLDPLL